LDFIFMLTQHDRTVGNCLDVLRQIEGLGVAHIGFKDVGVDRPTMVELVRGIKAAGATSYLEVVSTSAADIVRSLEAANDLGVDRVLGGTDIVAAKRILGDLGRYFPFPGIPVGHPTRLGGSPDLVADQCRQMREAGCGGVDLLAFRATEAEPMALIHAARRALPDRTLMVAGSVNSADRIHALAKAGVDAFTIGSAVLDHSFAAGMRSVDGQIGAVIAACQTAPRAAA
jgi:hypothetical protein